MMRRLLWILLFLPGLFAEDIIICGSGGTDEYTQRFADWGKRLRLALIEQCGRPAGKVHLFLENGTEEDNAAATSMDALGKFFSKLKTEHAANEPLLVYMIGHGSHLRNTAKFQMPGPDLTAEAMAGMLAEIPAQTVVVIDGSSASAGFINVLSGPGRVVVSATKSHREINATEYMGYFVQALEQGLADRDSDRRISVYEAAWRAASLTQNHYESQGLIATEHAILDDDGDGLGSRIFDESVLGELQSRSNDGELAKAVYIKDFKYPETVPAALVSRYESQLKKVAALKAQKSKLGEKSYRRQLETLLVEAARINRQIHRLLPEPAD